MQPDSLRARPTHRARIFTPIETSTQAGVQSSLDLSIVTLTQPANAFDCDNPKSVNLLQTVRKKTRVPVKITTAANRSRSPVSSAWSKEPVIVIAAQSFRNSLGDNSLDENFLRSARSFCGAITFRARFSALLTESHAQCVHFNSNAPRANSTADDRHSPLCLMHSSPPNSVQREHVCNPLRKPDSNFKARDSSRVQMVAAHAPTSCTDKPVSPLALLHLLVSRILQHCATVAKSARPQSQLAEHCSRAFVVFAAC